MSAKAPAVCRWQEDERFLWVAHCGFVCGLFEDAKGPHDYGWTYCPRCGKAIEVKR